MSRSKRKTPIFGHTTSKSEKRCKRIYNRRIRLKERLGLIHDISLYMEDEHHPIGVEIVDTWSLSKDGKHYWKKGIVFQNGKYMRK